MTPGGRRLGPAAAAIALAIGLVAAACGLPVNENVELLAQEDHLELLEGTTSTTIEEAEPGATDVTNITLYFIGQDDKLEAVVREFASPTTNEVLTALAENPREEERESFGDFGPIQTLLPAGLAPAFGTRADGVQSIIVDPEAGLRDLMSDQLVQGRLIVAQIVCTVLNLPIEDISAVKILDGGEEEIPLTDSAAQPIIGPATMADFNECATGSEERATLLEEEGGSPDESGTTTTTIAER